MLNIEGTTSKKLIAYIERVYDWLGLANYDAFYDVTFTSERLAGNAAGYCCGDEETIVIDIARYDDVGRIPMKDMMINIAHELVHAEQIVSGRLINRGFQFSRKKESKGELVYAWTWEGKRYVNTKYSEQPWEIEAYEMEKKIYEVCR
jgi:hypothetical protein